VEHIITQVAAAVVLGTLALAQADMAAVELVARTLLLKVLPVQQTQAVVPAAVELETLVQTMAVQELLL
jgi:hypothetical protein